MRHTLRGSVRTFADLLAKHPGSVGDDGVSGQSGYTPLHYAARSGHLEAVRMLIKAGANVNMTTSAGKATPLHRAAYMGHSAVAEALLHSGADASLQDADGQTALDKAAAQGHGHMIQLLRRHTEISRC
ncbi:g10416 [Coccomyxa viridis]|uniref:G10416 protein n=1 Tax=Coccomyxa viridis TaxID=1274662 RepID=A0ABP1G5C4_9CHLO